MIGDKQSRLVIRMEKIARLRAGSIPDKRIAQLCNMTPIGLARIVALPEYQKIEQEVLAKTTSLMDEALAGNANELRKHFAVGVPLAMNALVSAVRQQKDLRTQLEAARELLDRDPDKIFTKETLSLDGGAGRIVDIPIKVFESAVSVGRSVAEGAVKQKKELVEAMVPTAHSTGLEDVG